MKTYFSVLTAFFIAFSLSFCTPETKKMNGHFVCKQHYTNEMIDKLTLDIHPNGTIDLVSETMSSTGSYFATRDSIFIKTDFYDMRLKVKKDSLIGYNVVYVKRL